MPLIYVHRELFSYGFTSVNISIYVVKDYRNSNKVELMTFVQVNLSNTGIPLSFTY